jgi:hypothetical protein
MVDDWVLGMFLLYMFWLCLLFLSLSSTFETISDCKEMLRFLEDNLMDSVLWH